MTSVRRIGANRRNADKSTGPNTEEGKHRSRRMLSAMGAAKPIGFHIQQRIEGLFNRAPDHLAKMISYHQSS
jgi:hypothetical protein